MALVSHRSWWDSPETLETSDLYAVGWWAAAPRTAAQSPISRDFQHKQNWSVSLLQLSPTRICPEKKWFLG